MSSSTSQCEGGVVVVVTVAAVEKYNKCNFCVF